MSTRSNIGIENEDGTVSYVYCHSDGYPAHTGSILLEHYKAKKSVHDLLRRGDMRCVRSTPKEIEYYEDNTHCAPRTLNNYNECFLRMQEYFYLWTKDGWIYSDHKQPFIPLTHDACEVR